MIDEFSFSLADFHGTARLFPLPNLVLFPHVMQPLHIFEPRYRDLLEEALDDDRLVTMAMLAPGWERDYEGRPPLWPTACLGRIVVHHRLEDGGYNILLVGLCRVHLVRELPAVKSFREARVEVCPDRYPADEAPATSVLGRRLRNAFLRILPALPETHEQLDQLISGDVSLGTLTDIISYLLDIDLKGKEALLAETNVHRRAELLLGHLSRTGADAAPGAAASALFPPAFSRN